MPPTDDLASVAAALGLLRSLGGPPRLLRHGQIVADVAERLCADLVRLGVTVDAGLVVVGAALHDVGKINRPAELDGPGHEHEVEGERLLLGAGVRPTLAQVARTHGAGEGDTVSFEELLVIAADDLWKGTARDWVQRRVVAEVAVQLGISDWRAFLLVDPICEAIAAGAADRLADAR